MPCGDDIDPKYGLHGYELLVELFTVGADTTVLDTAHSRCYRMLRDADLVTRDGNNAPQATCFEPHLTQLCVKEPNVHDGSC